MNDSFDDDAVLTKDIPPRSELYSFAPIGIGSSEVECLTSYVNRLAWTYGIGPRLFIAEAILPNLRGSHSMQLFPRRLGSFCREDAMGINAAGESAADWYNTLERLTTRLDLRQLTLCSWASSLPSRGLLRKYPVWCPDCYAQWQEHSLPIYQPLYWMFQVVVVCLRHQRQLEERCPNCQKVQSSIAVKTQSGYCTQCTIWLGSSNSDVKHEIDDDILTWQQWVMVVIDELRSVSTNNMLSWEQCSANIATCSQFVGGSRKLARIVGLPSAVPNHWILGETIPSFKCLLELCYVLNISPLQLILSSQEDLIKHLQTKEVRQHPASDRLLYNQVNDERALELIDAVLNGDEAPFGVRQVERLLGLGGVTLVKHFPEKCALVTAKYKTYINERAIKRVERDCEEVRQATISLHEQGINPSKYHLAKRLSDIDLMRRPECREIWHRTRRELGLE